MSMHHWISTDTQEHDSCLVCGGMWQELHPGEVISEHAAANGDAPSHCTGNTRQCHHYQGDDECWRCHNDLTDLVCERDPECNCLFCV